MKNEKKEKWKEELRCKEKMIDEWEETLTNIQGHLSTCVRPVVISCLMEGISTHSLQFPLSMMSVQPSGCYFIPNPFGIHWYILNYIWVIKYTFQERCIDAEYVTPKSIREISGQNWRDVGQVIYCGTWLSCDKCNVTHKLVRVWFLKRFLTMFW